ncbi:hypothetical protein D7W79_18425 [Corallococcus exercitus]|nr:hypothetical protein D7W79_18425 [Corallococcus exercitus]
MASRGAWPWRTAGPGALRLPRGLRAPHPAPPPRGTAAGGWAPRRSRALRARRWPLRDPTGRRRSMTSAP